MEFTPISLQTYGVSGKEGLTLLLGVGRRTAGINNNPPRSTAAFLFHRISIAQLSLTLLISVCDGDVFAGKWNETDQLDEVLHNRCFLVF